MASQRKPCITCGKDPKRPGKHRCDWCWLATLPIEQQVEAALRRLAKKEAAPGYVYRSRVPSEQWPTGRRFCAGCQSFIPLRYCRNSRCIACDSRGKHESHIKRTFGIESTLYRRMLEWQDGRCYFCGRVPRSRRLAIDHDHNCCPGDTSCGNCVRGLLCADDERGCNHAILGNIKSLQMARRIVSYLELSPLKRMLAGEPPPVYTNTTMHDPTNDPPPY